MAHKPTFRDHVRDFATAFFGRAFERLTDAQRSEAVLRTYLEQVYRHVVADISDDDIDAGICDGAHDLGIDFVHRDNGRVLLLQAKYRRSGATREAHDDLVAFQSVLQRIQPRARASLRTNARLDRLLAEVDLAKDTFVLEYLTLGTIDGNAATIAEQGVAAVDGYADLGDRVQFAALDEQALSHQLRIALSQRDGIPDFVELNVEGTGDGRQALELDAGHRTLVAVVPASTLADAYRQHKERLFSLNIRSYLGRTATNKEIVRTVREEPESFLNFNNGIACICRDFAWLGPRRLRAERLQIINGAQTVRCLAIAGDAAIADALVHVKLTQVTDYYRADEERFFHRVIRFNNTQNVIKGADFRSNDPVQKDLQGKFARLTARGRRVHYQIKRTDHKPAGALHAITLGEFAKTLYAFLHDPADFASRTDFLFDDGEGGGYVRVFGDGREAFDSFTQDQFETFAGAWFVCEVASGLRAIDRKAAQTSGDAVAAGALERRYFLCSVLRLLMEKKHGPEYVRLLARYARADWVDDPTAKRWAIVRDYYAVARGVLAMDYGNAAGSAGFDHRNLTRSPLTFARLAQFVANMVPESYIPALDAA